MQGVDQSALSENEKGIRIVSVKRIKIRSLYASGRALTEKIGIAKPCLRLRQRNGKVPLTSVADMAFDINVARRFWKNACYFSKYPIGAFKYPNWV